MTIKKTGMTALLCIISIGVFLGFFSTNIINNPDLQNYKVLLDNCSLFQPCAVEPMFWFIADMANISNTGVWGLYSIHICIILFFLSRAGDVIFKKGSALKLLFPFIWFLSFGILHGLVQIRFGLAGAFSVYAIALADSRKKAIFFAITGFITHFSTALSMLVVSVRGHSRIFLLFLIFCIFFVVYFLSSNSFTGSLPSFVAARLAGYLTGSETVSTPKILFGLIFFIYLVGNSLLRFLPAQYMIAALGFMPYFAAPGLEILTRVGVVFQYFLLLIMLRDYRKRFIPLLPVFIFFLVKIISSVVFFFQVLIS